MKIRVPLKAQAEAVERSEPTRLPPGVASVLSVLSSSAVVLDNETRVLQASVAAQAFGLVKNDELVVQELLAQARQDRKDAVFGAGVLYRPPTPPSRVTTYLPLLPSRIPPPLSPHRT